jgi:hypothetical protein
LTRKYRGAAACPPKSVATLGRTVTRFGSVRPAEA